MEEQEQKQNLTDNFIKDLVELFVGREYDSIPEIERDELENKFINMFVDFILKYADQKYGEKELSRLKAVLMYGDEKVLEKFSSTNDVLVEALDEFLKITTNK